MFLFFSKANSSLAVRALRDLPGRSARRADSGHGCGWPRTLQQQLFPGRPLDLAVLLNRCPPSSLARLARPDRPGQDLSQPTAQFGLNRGLPLAEARIQD